MRSQSAFWLGAVATVLLLGACSVHITRNADGSLTAPSTISGDSLNAEIQAALADPLVQDLTVDLQPGYMNVSGTRKRLDGEQLDTLSFRLDLGVGDGSLTATVSKALIDGQAVDADRVALWNERIANRLENFSQRRSNSSLQSVTVDTNGVTLAWRIETNRSRGQ